MSAPYTPVSWHRHDGFHRFTRFVAIGAFLAAVGPNWAQTAPTSTERQRPGDEDEEVFVMSPFVVDGSSDYGYFGTKAISGTRVKSDIRDVAAAITVITKDQIQDTASADINDLFLYEVGTEGIYQWTSFSVANGAASDDVADNPHGSTRMRGVSAANIAVDSFETTLPIDTYNVDAVEISRGPNSSLFGLGRTGGSVNLRRSQAILGREITTFTTQGNSYGGYRGTFDINRTLIADKLSVRASGLYDEKGFERKPSADTTRRVQFAMTAQPTKKTTLRAIYETYRNYANRPNSMTPRDMMSDWIAYGSPTYNPITRTVNYGDGRPSVGPITPASPPAGLTQGSTVFTARPSWYIDNGNVELYTINRLPNATGAIGPNNGGDGRTLLLNASFYESNVFDYPLYVTPGVTDRSIYDWTSINLLAPNYKTTRAETLNLELEQIFLHSSRQLLALQAGWFRERSRTDDRSFLARQDNGKTQVFIDINEKLLDGSDNPYFLRPFLLGTQPRYRKPTSDNDHYRSTLAYQYDFSQDKGWQRWLGRHNLTAYGEYREVLTSALNYVDVITSTEAWMDPQAASFSRLEVENRISPRYYVGGATGGRVEYAPSIMPIPDGSYTFRYRNGPAGVWIDEPVDVGNVYYSGGYNRRLLSTYGAAWQGLFLDRRLITTFGVRKDINRSRQGNDTFPPSPETDGLRDPSRLSSFDDYDWVERSGLTTTAGVVLRVLPWLRLTYNQANSFLPGDARYDLYMQVLPDPEGRTKDYGFDLDLLPDRRGRSRLNIRFKQFEMTDLGLSAGISSTLAGRILRLDYDRDAASAPELAEFYRTELRKLYPAWTASQIDTETVRLMGIDPGLEQALELNRGDYDKSTSRGRELEIGYNPTRWWTVKANVTQTKSFSGVVSETLQQFLNERLEYWTTATSPFDGQSYWNHPTFRRNNRNARGYYEQAIYGPLKLALAQQGKPKMQTREWRANIVTNLKLSGVTDKRWLKPANVGAALRWESKATIGFLGKPPEADGIQRELDPDLPVWDRARAYVDVWTGYDFNLFKGKVQTRLQLNVRNVFEDGRLQAVAVNPDGVPWAYRIIDPRQFILTATFKL